MTMVLDLSAEQEARLHAFARSQGKDIETLIANWVEELTPPVSEAATSRETTPQNLRVAGLHQGWVTYMSADFDDPLPDAFWFPNDEENTLLADQHTPRTI